MKIIINAFFWLWSHSPVLALSDDDNFATLTSNNFKNAHLRFSIVNIMLGDTIIYLLTINIKLKEIKLIQKLHLNKMPDNELTDNHIEEIQNRYRIHLTEISKQELEIEKEALDYRIKNEEQRFSSSVEKINIYTTIMLTIIPLLLAFIDFNKIINLPLALQFLIGIIIYSLLNICIYIFRTIKVRGIKKSSFGDLRSSVDKNKEINVQYQYDWQQLKYKSNLLVSFILNIQEWVIAVLFLSVISAVTISVVNENNNFLKGAIEYDNVETVHIDELDKAYNESSIIWASFILDIEQKNCTRVLFIVGIGTDTNSLTKRLYKYKELEMNIIVDKELEKGIIKIVQEEPK